MNKDINKVDDKELKNVTGGARVSLKGGICPINGKHCKHGRVSRVNGRCIYAGEGAGVTPMDFTLDQDGNVIKTGGEEYTYLTCNYINDQE